MSAFSDRVRLRAFRQTETQLKANTRKVSSGERVAIRIQKGGWFVIFLLGVGLVGYSLHRYGIIDLSQWLPGPTKASSASVILRIHGSNTIGAQLAPALAEEFLRQRGATDVKILPQSTDEVVVQGKLPGESAPKSIEIAAHGSATAFTDLRDNKCDVGAASRKINLDEVSTLSSLGDMVSPASEHVVGLDGIAVIVNAGNPVRVLSKEEIGKIFSGEVTDWGQVNGGQRGTINVYARDTKSGTWDTFKTLVLGNIPLVDTAKRLEDSRQLSDRVAADPNGIGFIGLPYVRSAKAIAVSEAGANSIYPTALTVATEDYPLSRRLYLYTPANAQNTEVREFVRFALSKTGQDIVAQNGFVGQTATPMTPAPQELARRTGQSAAETRYHSLTVSAARVPLDFRFRSGSSNLDNKALDDLLRVSAFVSSPQYSGEAILLIGFADSIGNPQQNLELSRERANAVAGEFKARGIKTSEVVAFGSELPVASNATPEGRDRNRRVEVWLRR